MFTRKDKPETKDTGKPISSPSATKPLDPTTDIANQTSAATKSSLAQTHDASIIESGMTISGNVISDGEVHVKGTIKGDIHCARLLVTKTATVNGTIVAKDAEIQGRVTGTIRAMQVTLAAGAQVEADVYHASLAMEQGAFFEGKSHRSDDPISKAPKTQKPTADTASITVAKKA
jgi:cytoskeletal protein CcmA (bactofilin family)